MFSKDTYPDEFFTSWKNALKKDSLESIDVSLPLALLMGPKEENEVINVKKACMVTVDVFTKYLKDQIMEIIDSDKVCYTLALSLFTAHLLFLLLLQSYSKP